MYTTCHAHQLITAITDQIDTFHKSQVVGKIGNLPPRHSRLSQIQISPTRIHSSTLLASQTSLWVKAFANELITVAIRAVLGIATLHSPLRSNPSNLACQTLLTTGQRSLTRSSESLSCLDSIALLSALEFQQSCPPKPFVLLDSVV